MPLPILEKEQNPNGLFQKYIITRTNGKPMDPGTECFILRLDEGAKDKTHLRACRLAILTYAEAIAATKPEMAMDLYDRYNIDPGTNIALKAPLHI